MNVIRSRVFWLGVIILCLGVAAGVFAYNYGRSLGRALPVGDAPKIASTFVPTAAATVNPFEVTAQPAPIVIQKAWDGKERLNVLLMGIDQRQGETELGYRTDTMIVLTLDPATLQGGMLSVPRDMWVPIPGYGNARINTANDIGDRVKYPGGGPALARKTVENVLGIKIQHYVRLNFTAFEDVIDRLGGITVDVPNDILDPTYPTDTYSTQVFSITHGIQKLNGDVALKYARTRHNSTDFERAKRQQQVMLAVQEQLKNPRIALSLFASGPEIMQNLSSSVQTDLTLDQIQQLATLATQIDRKNIRSEVIDENYTEYRDTADGQNVVVPNRAAMAKLRTSFFTSTPVQ